MPSRKMPKYRHFARFREPRLGLAACRREGGNVPECPRECHPGALLHPESSPQHGGSHPGNGGPWRAPSGVLGDPGGLGVTLGQPRGAQFWVTPGVWGVSAWLQGAWLWVSGSGRVPRLGGFWVGV